MQPTYYVEERILRFVYRYKVQSESFVTDHEIMAFSEQVISCEIACFP